MESDDNFPQEYNESLGPLCCKQSVLSPWKYSWRTHINHVGMLRNIFQKTMIKDLDPQGVQLMHTITIINKNQLRKEK